MTSSAATAANDTPDLGALPTWDLSDLYPGMDSAELKADLDRMERECKAFRERYAGKLAALTGDDLAAAIRGYEDIDETLSRVMSYAGLVYNGNMVDPTIAKFYQSAQERVNDISAHLIFFTLEVNRLDDDGLATKQAASAALRHYEPWLRDVRLYRDHQLSDEIERLLHEKHVVGRAAWNRLFDETIASLRFPMGGPNGVRELTCAEALNRLSDRNPAVRREAGEAVGKVLGDNARLFALITNTLAKDKEIEDDWRNYPTPTSARNLSNRVEDEVVDALVSAVKGAYPDLSHRYYAMKAKWFGQDHLDYWDRNAPLPEDADRSIPWGEARDIVLGAYGRFSPDLASLGKRFFDNPWIDAPVRPGKAPGAFAHPTVPSVHPLSAGQLPGQDARRDDAGPRAWARCPSNPGRQTGAFPVRYPADAGGDGVGVRRDADLPGPAGGGDRPQAPPHHAGRQGRGHAEHGGAPDRLLRFRTPRPHRTARRRTDVRPHRRDLDGGAERKPRPGVAL